MNETSLLRWSTVHLSGERGQHGGILYRPDRFKMILISKWKKHREGKKTQTESHKMRPVANSVYLRTVNGLQEFLLVLGNRGTRNKSSTATFIAFLHPFHLIYLHMFLMHLLCHLFAQKYWPSVLFPHSCLRCVSTLKLEERLVGQREHTRSMRTLTQACLAVWSEGQQTARRIPDCRGQEGE